MVEHLCADGAAITCVATGPDGRVFTGDANGMVRCYARATTISSSSTTTSNNSGNNSSNNASAREAEPADGDREATALQWATRATTHGAILSICAIADPRAVGRAIHGDAKSVAACANTLLVVGTASGELVFFRNETEMRRVQLESAVLAICAHGRDAEFLAGDLLGTLYGVHQYGVLWKERLGGEGSQQQRQQYEECHDGATRAAAPPAFLFPPAAQPTVRAIASVNELDIEHTLSSYALVSTGQRHLLLTHRGSAFARIATSSPVTTIASIAAAAPTLTTSPGGNQRDIVLAAGEAGEVYQVLSFREPTFRFTVDVFAEVGFPVTKLLAIDSPTTAHDGDSAAFTWVCLGDHGQLALFRGRELLRTWHSLADSHSKSRPVDIAVVCVGSSRDAHVAIAFPDRVELLRVPTQQ